MVDTQVRPSDVTKFPIIDAMLAVPREDFVPEDEKEAAYIGENLKLTEDRVILEPRTFAKLLDILNIQPNEVVLDLGAGLGYSTAILAHIAEFVVGVESYTNLASDAQSNLSGKGVDNAAILEAPLTEGAEKSGPYDVVILEGAVEIVPEAILSQIKEGGRIASLFVEDALGVARIGYKIDGRINWHDSFHASAPILSGFEKNDDFVL